MAHLSDLSVRLFVKHCQDDTIVHSGLLLRAITARLLPDLLTLKLWYVVGQHYFLHCG